MPLTLDCVCAGDSVVCELLSLSFELDVDHRLFGSPTISATQSLNLYADPTDPAAATMMLDTTSGHYSYDMPLADWKDKFDTITVQLTSAATSVQVPSPAYSAYDLFRATYYIAQNYRCTNAQTGEVKDWIVKSYSTDPDSNNKCDLDVLRFLCFAGRGVNSVFYKSTPLAACTSCSIGDKKFYPPVTKHPKVDMSTSGVICLCANGATGDYVYKIVSGTLPSGLTLNPATGCIDGTADGVNPGSPQVTFSVTDRGGGGAPVGSTRTIGGSCKIELPWVHRISGGSWLGSMVGGTIVVDGVSYTVLTVPDPDHMTVA
jgi:hypothetical protein